MNPPSINRSTPNDFTIILYRTYLIKYFWVIFSRNFRLSPQFLWDFADTETVKLLSRNKKASHRSARDPILPDAETQRAPQLESQADGARHDSGHWRHSPIILGALVATVFGAVFTESLFRLRDEKSALSFFSLHGPDANSEFSGPQVELTSQIADYLSFDPRPLLKAKAHSTPTLEQTLSIANRPLDWETARRLFTRETIELESALNHSTEPLSQTPTTSAFEKLLLLSLVNGAQPLGFASLQSSLWDDLRKNPIEALTHALTVLQLPGIQDTKTIETFVLSTFDTLLPLTQSSNAKHRSCFEENAHSRVPASAENSIVFPQD